MGGQQRRARHSSGRGAAHPDPQEGDRLAHVLRQQVRLPSHHLLLGEVAQALGVVTLRDVVALAGDDEGGALGHHLCERQVAGIPSAARAPGGGGVHACKGVLWSAWGEHGAGHTACQANCGFDGAARMATGDRRRSADGKGAGQLSSKHSLPTAPLPTPPCP